MSHIRLIGAARNNFTILSTKLIQKENPAYYLMASRNKTTASHTRSFRRPVDLEAVPVTSLRPRTDYKRIVQSLVGNDSSEASRDEDSSQDALGIDLNDVKRAFAVSGGGGGATAFSGPTNIRDPVAFLDSVASDKINPRGRSSTPTSSTFAIKTGIKKPRKRNVAWAWTEEEFSEGDARSSKGEASSSSSSSSSQVAVGPAEPGSPKERGTVSWESLETPSDVRPRLDVNEILLKSSQLRKVGSVRRRDGGDEDSKSSSETSVGKRPCMEARTSWDALERGMDSGPMTITTTRFLQRPDGFAKESPKSSVVDLFGVREMKGAVLETDGSSSREAFLFDPGGTPTKGSASWAHVEALDDGERDFVARELDKYKSYSKSTVHSTTLGKRTPSHFISRPANRYQGLKSIEDPSDVRVRVEDADYKVGTSSAIFSSTSISPMEESGMVGRGHRERRWRSWMAVEAADDAPPPKPALRRRNTKEKKKESSAFVDFIKEELFHAGAASAESFRGSVKDVKPRPRKFTKDGKSEKLSSMSIFAPEVAKMTLSRKSNNDVTDPKDVVVDSTLKDVEESEVTKPVVEIKATTSSTTSSEGTKVKLMVESLEATSRKSLDMAMPTSTTTLNKRKQETKHIENEVETSPIRSDELTIKPDMTKSENLWFIFFDNIVRALGFERKFSTSTAATKLRTSDLQDIKSQEAPSASTKKMDDQRDHKTDLELPQPKKFESVVKTDKTQFYKEFLESLKKLRR